MSAQQADKNEEKKSQSLADQLSEKKSGGISGPQFVDNRPEAIQMRKLQDVANNSDQSKQAAQLQAMVDTNPAKRWQPVQKKANTTGLPDQLKTGVENLSGYSLDDVQVHYNSGKPAQLQANAFAQDDQIHIGPGQEKHLAHEAWHVVQQKQGRVETTRQLQDKVNINDNADLEKEADVMGAEAENNMDESVRDEGCGMENTSSESLVVQRKSSAGVIQRNVTINLSGAGAINRVEVDRTGESGIFGAGIGHAGDHTTAHVVFRYMIANQLIGRTLAEAPAILRHLYDEIWNMPGNANFDDVPQDLEDNFDNAAIAAMAALDAVEANADIATVQTAAQAILNFRNSVPLSAFAEGRVGGGEGPQAARLQVAQRALRADPTIDIETLLGQAPPFNGDGTAAQQILTAVVRLLDTGRISQDLEGEVDTDETPGMSGDYESDREDLANQHLQTIALAFPDLWAVVLAAQEDALRQRLIAQMEIGNYKDEEYVDD
ncbi:MAG: hypothetical protein K0S33_166 [Bacteroidetes bacterium]|jgi:hypothetical protein|nr:hypothetical protein [Bacteroidota bacterium]